MTLVDNDLVHLVCPLCASPDLKDLGALTCPRAVQFSSATITLSRTPTLGQCNPCGSRFVQHAIPQETAAKLYKESDAGARWTSHRKWERMHSPAVVAGIAALAQSNTRLLDVGCNTGELLDFARSRGAKTMGVEYSSTSRERVAAKHHAIVGDLREAKGPFDVITAFDLVEHLYDAPAFFADVAMRLRAGGRLVVLTGDIECEVSQREGPAWWYVQPPEHVVFPSRAFWGSIKGFSVASIVSTHNGPAAPTGLVASVARRLRRLVGARPRATPVVDHNIVTLERVIDRG